MPFSTPLKVQNLYIANGYANKAAQSPHIYSRKSFILLPGDLCLELKGKLHL